MDKVAITVELGRSDYDALNAADGSPSALIAEGIRLALACKGLTESESLDEISASSRRMFGPGGGTPEQRRAAASVERMARGGK